LQVESSIASAAGRRSARVHPLSNPSPIMALLVIVHGSHFFHLFAHVELGWPHAQAQKKNAVQMLLQAAVLSA